MSVRVFTGGPFQENGYLVRCPETNRAIAVDPGGGTPALLDALREEGATLDAIVLTHAHLDHVDGIPFVREAWPEVPIRLHPKDLELYRAAPRQAELFGLTAPTLPEPDEELREGEVVEVGDSIRLEILFTPGHAPGHVTLVEREAGWALVGDVIFLGSIGRTDLPGGNFRTLMASIREEILTLPDGMRLLPGHGPETTVEHERRGNPFLTPQYLGQFA